MILQKKHWHPFHESAHTHPAKLLEMCLHAAGQLARSTLWKGCSARPWLLILFFFGKEWTNWGHSFQELASDHDSSMQSSVCNTHMRCRQTSPDGGYPMATACKGKQKHICSIIGRHTIKLTCASRLDLHPGQAGSEFSVFHLCGTPEV